MPERRASQGPIALGVALVLALVEGSAAAAPRVMVWPGRPGYRVAPIEDALGADGVEVVRHQALAEAIERHRRDTGQGWETRWIERTLEGAQERYLRLELGTMILLLEDAEPHAVRVSGAGRCEGLWELEFRRGLGHWAQGQTAEAGARFELALELDPDRRPLAELYGPDVTAAFLQALATQGNRIERPVALRVEPPDAVVDIDCRERDGDRVALRPGLHAVRARAPGFAPWGAVVDLHERDAIEVRLVPLDPADDPLERWAKSTEVDGVDDGSPSAHAALMDVARSQGAAAVLVVTRTPQGVRVRPWGIDGIGTAVERADPLQAVRAALALLDDDGRLQAPAPVVAPGPGPDGRPQPAAERKPVLRTWWFWTIVGSVALTGTAVGLGVGLGRREPAPGKLVVLAR